MSLSAQFRRVGNLQRGARRGRAAHQDDLVHLEDLDAELEQRRLSERLPSMCLDARFNTDSIDAVLADDRRAREHEEADNDAANIEVDGSAAGVDAAAAEGNGSSHQEKRWWHVWTKAAGSVEGVPYVDCLLPPEGASAKQPHCTRMASKNPFNVQRHFKSTHHKASYERLNRVVTADSKAEVAVAKDILDAALEAQKKRKDSTPFKQGVGSRTKKIEQEIMLLSFFVDQGIAFNAVENEFFEKYHTVYQWSTPPNRRRLADILLPSAHEHAHEWLVNELKDALYFSIITDAWTSATLDKFVALNVCFVSAGWLLKTLTLSVIPLNESHTWQTMTTAIARRINAALPDDAVLVTTVTDNGANFVKLARSLHSNLPIADIEGLYQLNSWDEPVDVEDESTASWRCVAHKTQLAVNDVIDDSSDVSGARSLIERVRLFTRFMRASTARRAALSEAQRALNMPIRVPTLDVATRWSAAFYMLERFYENYDAYVLMARRGEFDDEPEIEFVTPAELVIVKGLVDALSPIEKLIRLVEGEKYVTLAIVPVYYKRCLEELAPRHAAQGGALSGQCVRFRHLLRQSLKKRLDYILERPNLALAAAALHPQHGHLQFVDAGVRNAVWRELEMWIVGDAQGENAFPAPVRRVCPEASGPVLPPAAPSSQVVRAALTRVRRGFEDHYVSRERQRQARRAAGDDDDSSDDVDPLAWWSRNASELPSIQHIAKIVFCVPATSAASERVFSSSGVSATSLRARLDVDKVEMMTVLRSVLHAMGARKWQEWLRNILQHAHSDEGSKKRRVEQ